MQTTMFESKREKSVPAGTGKLFLDALDGQASARAPFWFMRQAGRYLPEYRALREQKGGFLAMAMDPEAACEITMQPVRRFGMDAAIIFSDILVVPQALGRKLEFMEGEGPKLDPVESAEDIVKMSRREGFEKNLDPVFEAIRKTRSQLAAENFPGTALIGFAGAPWTVAAYMVDGKGGGDFPLAKKMALGSPEVFSALIDVLTRATSIYLCRQIESGAEAVQIFDSWAGLLDDAMFRKWAIDPARKIVSAIRGKYPHVPVIGFPRGVNTANYLAYARETGITAIGLDQSVSTRWAADVLQPLLPVQGNLDPADLMAGGDRLKFSVERIFADLEGGSFVFNLGHGVHKDTPVDHVAALCAMLKNGWTA